MIRVGRVPPPAIWSFGARDFGFNFRFPLALFHQAEFARVLPAQEQIQIWIPPRIPIAPAAFPISTPEVAQTIAHHLDGPRVARPRPHVKNKFGATTLFGQLRHFGFDRARSRLIFHRAYRRDSGSAEADERCAISVNNCLGESEKRNAL
jgi:hypothetical protein